MKRFAAFCLTFLALFMTIESLCAQYYKTNKTEDTQLHTGFDVTSRINDRWSVNWGEEFYFGNNMSEYQKLYSRLMVSYYLLPNLRIAPLVMVVANRPAQSKTMIYDFNVIYTHRIDRLAITLRGGTRVQDALGVERVHEGVVRTNPEFQLRGHFAVGYRLHKYVEPYADIEGFYLLNPATDDLYDPETYTAGHYFPRVRSNVGVKFHVDGNNTISLYWRYDHTQSKHLSYELVDAPFGIITKDSVVNFLGIFYHYRF